VRSGLPYALPAHIPRYPLWFAYARFAFAHRLYTARLQFVLCVKLPLVAAVDARCILQVGAVANTMPDIWLPARLDAATRQTYSRFHGFNTTTAPFGYAVTLHAVLVALPHAAPRAYVLAFKYYT